MDLEQLSIHERAWWSRYSRSYARQPANHEAQHTFDAFVQTVREHHVTLGPPPLNLKPHTIVGATQMERMTACLREASDKQGQADVLGDVPKTAEEAAALFASGYAVADANLIYAHSARRNDLADLLKAPSYGRAKVAAHRWLATRPQHPPWAAYKAFFRELEQPSLDPEETLTEPERVVVLQLGTLTPPAEQKRGRLLVFVERARQVKSQLGSTVWQSILRVDRAPTFSLRAVVAVMELLLDLDGRVDTTQHLADFVQNDQHTLHHLRRDLLRAQRQNLAAAFPERNLQETLQRFGATDQDVQKPLAARDRQALQANFQTILELTSRAQAMPNAQVKETAQALKTCIAKGERPSHADRMLLLALLREGIRRHLGIQPYDTQMLVVLGLLRKPQELRGRIAQVKTGEGKSTIVAILAAYLAITNHTVDVISSARPLASRDCEKYASFFSTFGVSTSHICTDSPRAEDFLGQIIYGTNYDFEFSILRDNLYGTSTRGGRTQDVVLIDEVDNLFIDRGNDSAILGASCVDDGKWQVPAVVRFAETTVQENLIKAIAVDEAALSPLRAFLVGYEGGRFAKAAESLSDFQVRRLAKSYYGAFIERDRDVDYVVRPKQDEPDPARLGQDAVQIVDLGTGQLQPACRWQNRLHQFVEHKHDLVLQDETVTAAELTHPLFFNDYRNIFGVTGTLGSDAERHEVREVYNADAFDVPAHRPSLRTTAPMVLCQNADAHREALLGEIRGAQRAGRACLVLLATIRDTETFSQYLASVDVIHQLLNAVQAEDESIVIARAGRNGAVTVATNTAGRGTDILLSRDVREAGGLRVVMGCYPENDRVEAQGLGRAGRQGQEGSGVLVVNVEDLPHDAKKLGPPTAASLALYRKELQAKESASRIAMARLAHLHHQKMTDFFGKLAAWRAAIDDNFLDQMNLHLLAQAPQAKWEALTKEEDNAALAHLLRLAAAQGGSASHFRDWLDQFKERLDRDLVSAWGRCFEELKDDAEANGALSGSFFLGLHAMACDTIYDRFCDRFGSYAHQPHRAFRAVLAAALAGIRTN